jgi:multidrug efflux pump subunit AcrB
MKLPELSIKNYQFTIVVFSVLIIMGITSFLTMPRTEDPPLQLPGASVIILYPGANPSDMEQLIADPLEESLNQLDDIKRIETSCRDGIAISSIEFTFDTDADEKFDEVVQQVNTVRNRFPSDIYGLQILQWTSQDVAIMQLALISESAEYYVLDDKAEKLKKEIEKINGVKQVQILALPEQEVRISLDIEKMAQMNISIEQVRLAILSNNANVPGGSIKVGTNEFDIRTSGSYKALDEIGNTIVSSYQGRIIYLKNIAEVKFDYEDQIYMGRYNGQRCIFMTVKEKENVNIFSIKGKIASAMSDFSQGLDKNIQLVTVFDQSESVKKRINGFMNDLLQGIILVGLVIFLSLGVRESILVMLAVPFSIVVGLAFVDYAGFGLQQISIAGLVIVLGMLVDDSIVVVQNIERFLGLGFKRMDAAIQATKQLAWPVVSATVTTMLAFIPIIAMPDKAGRFIQSMPVTVIFTLFASLILALSLTPYLASVFLRSKSEMKKRKINLNLKNFLNRTIEGPYRKTLDFALRHKWLILSLTLFAFAGSIFLFRFIGVSYFPKAEKPQLMIRIDTPESSSIDKSDEVARYVENILDTLPGVRQYATNVGHGNPRIYYNTFPKQYEKSFAEIYVEFKKYDYDQFTHMVKTLRELFNAYPGARINVKEFEQGAPIEAPLTIKVTGDNPDVLARISGDVEQFVRNTRGAVNIENQLSKTSTDLFFDINREKAGMLGVPVVEIDRTIRTCISGIPISKFRDKEGEEYNIVLRLPFEKKVSLSDFDKIYVTSLSGRAIPLKQLASIEFKEAPGLITHFDLDRCGTITADIIQGYELNDVVKRLEVQLKNYPWPEGYNYKFTGEVESREESFGGIIRASIIALLAIFAILVMQFKSFVQPLIIYSAIPLAVIGSILTLFVTGYTFSFTAGIGMVSLIGIVIKNSILLVDYVNVLRAEGKPIIQALKEGGETRFIPILLTAMTTIGGLLPMTIQGGTLWAPMGWTIIGGLFFSTFLTLVVVPVLYKLFIKEIKPIA